MEFPLSLLDHARRYGDEKSCRIALTEMRWSDGFVCRHCGHPSAYHVVDSEVICRSCGWRTSPGAGTILRRSHLPLTKRHRLFGPLIFTSAFLFLLSNTPVANGGQIRTIAHGSPTAVASSVLHVPVLMYHLIDTPGVVSGALPDLVVPPATFAAQMKALHDNGWHTITAAALAANLAAGIVPPRRTFVLTFDDGYANGYTNALPILKRYGFVGTFYVITGRVGKKNYFTWKQLKELVAAGNEIGNHTQSHYDLQTLSPSTLAYQIANANKTVMAKIGYQMKTLAYPAGDYDDAVMAAVGHAGLTMAFTTEPGAQETIAGRFHCPRVRVSPGTGASSLVVTLTSLSR